MANAPYITAIGSITEPQIRFTNSGKAVTSFNLASTPREKVGDDWQDGETTWFRVTVWDKEGAESVADSLQKGDRVIVHGTLKTGKPYEKNGETRPGGLEITADEVGPSLRFATAKPVKKSKSSANYDI